MYISRAFFINTHTYTKKREVHLFLTLFKGFAIPVLSRKTTEVHARYVSPTSPYDGRGAYLYIPTGHSLGLLRLYAELCEDSEQSQTTFTINAFYYVIPFYVSDLTLRFYVTEGTMGYIF